jgi:predicted nucleic acid-binding protein
MIYLDTSYIAKCYLNEPGSSKILRWLEGKSGLSCCHHGRLELVCALKRHQRDGRIRFEDLHRVLQRLEADERDRIWRWLPVTTDLVREACRLVASLPRTSSVRSADALHLTCAATRGFGRIYTHDQHMLRAAPRFGLDGVDILTE